MEEPLKDWLTVDEYAKQEGITKAGVHFRMNNGLIPRENIVVLPKKTQILIKRGFNVS